MQSAIDWYLKCVRTSYADFNGRASREEFWYYVLVQFVIFVVLGILTKILFLFWFVEIVYWLATIIPGIAVGVRRLHDTNKPTVWILLGLIPFVGLYLIYLWILEGDAGANDYGPPPSTNAASATAS